MLTSTKGSTETDIKETFLRTSLTGFKWTSDKFLNRDDVRRNCNGV